MKASKRTIRARVEDLARVILDGATPWQIRQYVAEREAAGEEPWTRPEGRKGLSARQIERYADRADELLADACAADRKKLLRRHVAQRQGLFARAVNKGDERTALAVLADLAKLQGLYPSEDDELKREAEALRKQLAERKGADGGGGNGNDAKGTEGAGERGEGLPQPDP
jgi:hypothetical protein